MYPSNGWSCPGISGLQVELLCVCVSISWFISKPPRGWGWGEEWQTHQPETTDRDELILVVENSRHSNRVLHPGRVHRRVGSRPGFALNKQAFLESRRVEIWCQTHWGGTHALRYAWKDARLTGGTWGDWVKGSRVERENTREGSDPLDAVLNKTCLFPLSVANVPRLTH